MRSLWIAVFLLFAPIVAHAQSTPNPVSTWCASSAAGPWTPCVGSGGGSPSSPSYIKPGTYTEVPLDIATTTSANVAVAALSAGHRSAGGWIQNPPTATTVICVNTITTAAFSSGACIGSNNAISPGQVFNIPANANAVSVVSSDATHPFSGEGLQ